MNAGAVERGVNDVCLAAHLAEHYCAGRLTSWQVEDVWLSSMEFLVARCQFPGALGLMNSGVICNVLRQLSLLSSFRRLAANQVRSSAVARRWQPALWSPRRSTDLCKSRFSAYFRAVGPSVPSLVNALADHVPSWAIAAYHGNITIGPRHTAAHLHRISPNYLGVVSNILPIAGTGDIGKNAADEISLFITPNSHQLGNGIKAIPACNQVFSDTRTPSSITMLELPGRG